MKLLDAIRRVDKSERNETHVEADELNNVLGTCVYLGGDDWDSFHSRFKAYWIAPHYCTDTWVGLCALYLDGKPIGVGYQPARKSDMKIRFISEACMRELRDVLLSFERRENPEADLIDPEEDIGGSFKVHYAAEVLSKTATLDGTTVEVDLTHRTDYNQPVEEWSRINVRFPDGTKKRVEVAHLEVPFNLE